MERRAVSRTVAVVVIIVILVVAVFAVFELAQPGAVTTTSSSSSTSSSKTSTSTTSSTTSTSSSVTPTGTFVIGSNYEPLTANPLFNVGNLPDFERLVFNGLVDLDPHWVIVPDLALSWTSSADLKSFTFNLRHDVTFQDGVPMTAKDVVFTYQKFADPNIGSAVQGVFANMTAKAVDNYTVQFTFPVANPSFVTNLWYGVLPYHLLSNVPDAQMKSANFSTYPVGTGPYKLVKWIPQTEIDLVANMNYFKGPPHIARVVVKIIPDTTATITAIQAKEIDIYNSNAAAGGITPVMIQQTNSTGYVVQSFPGPPQLLFMGPQNEAPWNNILVRQAILYSINRTELIDKILPGGGSIWNTPYVCDWAVNPNLTPIYNYNVTKAAQLLDQAGYKPDSSGIRLKTTIYATSGTRTLFSQLISIQLAKVGIQATVQTVGDFTAYWNLLSFQRTENGIWTLFESTTADPIASTDLDFPSSNIRPGGGNLGGINDTHLDQMLLSAQTNPNFAMRQQAYYQIENYISQNAYEWALWRYTGFNIVTPKLVGCPATPAFGMAWACLDNATLTS